MKAEIDLSAMMRRFTLVARLHGVELRGQRRFYWRMRLALWLYRMGSLVAGVGFKIEEGEDRGKL